MSALAALKVDDFGPYVGAAYEVMAGAHRVPLTLEAAEPLGQAQREGGAFRLVFRGPAEPLLEQAIYPLTRDGETLEIFIVPVGRGPRGAEYEAIFT